MNFSPPAPSRVVRRRGRVRVCNSGSVSEGGSKGGNGGRVVPAGYTMQLAAFKIPAFLLFHTLKENFLLDSNSSGEAMLV